MQLLKKLEVW